MSYGYTSRNTAKVGKPTEFNWVFYYVYPILNDIHTTQKSMLTIQNMQTSLNKFY